MHSSHRANFRIGFVLATALSCFWATGCATKSTIETRRLERPNAYATLPDEQRTLVDRGQIQAGMTEDAVYIAMGKPAEILRGGDASGETVTWLYHGLTSDDYWSWHYYPVHRRNGTHYLNRTLDRSLDVRSYVKAELIFRNGRLEKWKTLPRPPSRSFYAPSPWPF